MDSSGSNLVIALSLLFLLFRPSVSQQPNTDSFYVSTFFQNMGVPLSLPKDDAGRPGSSSSSSSLLKSNSNIDICSWKGVSCDTQQQYVTALSASGLGLSGTIPDTTLGKLTKLQSLDLSNNKIDGPLPSDLWSLTSLKYLNLSINRISDTLSSNVGNFGMLESLDLSINNFSGKIPEAIGSLQNLKILKLNVNGFESLIPSGIQNCRLLVSIDLSCNKLNGTLPHGFGSEFRDLKYLNLARNGIIGRAVDFYGLGGTKINNLNISGNMFEGFVMGLFEDEDEDDIGDDEQEAVRLLPLDLEVIDLSRNHFQGQISEVKTSTTSFFNWSRLIYLDLSENNISGRISNVLNQSLNLRHLNLAYNGFSEQTFPSIDMLTHLEYLNLSQSNLTGHVPFDVLSLLNGLTTLDISNNRLRGPMSRLLSGDDSNLRVLDVSFNNLSGSIPVSVLQRLPYMESYNFSYNNLTVCPSSGVSNHEMFRTAFIGLESDCPIAANATFYRTKRSRFKGLKLALALTLSMICLFVGLLFLAFCCRKRSRMWVVKPQSCVPTQKDKDHQIQPQQDVSGPFSFQTDSSTWVADVKQATMVPVVIFDKPLLNFTFADLLDATSNFDRGTLLAEGRFGPVYRGFLAGGIHVAVKVLVHGSTLTDQEAAGELEHLGRIKHPNLVPLTGYCLAGEQRIAIYEYMENGNLQNLLHDLPLGVQNAGDHRSMELWEEVDGSNGARNICSEGLLTSWRFRHKIALGTARALAFLHHGCSPPIVHRDVKASCVYLDSELEPRLSDFGLAKVLGNGPSEDDDDDDDSTTHGSPGYLPPELTEQTHSNFPVATPKSDVYGFGVVLFELITGKKPVGDDYPDDKGGSTLVSWVRGLVKKNQGLKAIDQKIRGTGADHQMKEALKIGYLCTADLPSKRPSMHQIVGLLKDIEPVDEQ